ncbi:MAG: molybdopterin biosynthesis protein [Thermodesulfobacteriota bacterium]
MSRDRYPARKPLGDARRLMLAAARPLATREPLRAEDALGRVTAEAVHARASVPHYHGAAMDGIAVRAEDTAGATDAHPVDLEHGTPDRVARPFAWVDTGNALPAWANAVVMIERVFTGGAASAASDAGGPRTVSGREARVVHVRAAAPPWQHVRLVGEDVVAGEPLLPRGHRIRPWDVGALLAAGVEEVAVRPRPVVAILPTGDELIEPGEPRRPGRIVEFNSRMIAAFVEEWGGAAVRLPPVRDDLDAIRARVDRALDDADVVCVIAGSSAGQRDFSALALGELGELLVQGIEVMPGKPAIVVAVAAERGARASVALGIPGYPVSAAVVCRELLEPLVAHLLGAATADRPTVRAVVPRRVPSRLGQEELVRVALGEVGERLVASPLARGAGAITTMARADGFLRIPRAVEVLSAGDEVEVELLRPLAEVLGTIVVAGSHDPVLGVLEDALRSTHARCKLATRSIGGVAGLVALGRDEAHVAAIGAFDALPDAEGLLAGRPVVVVHLVARELGLVVAPGNPLGLTSLADLARDDVRGVPEPTRGSVRLVAHEAVPHRRGGVERKLRGEQEHEELTPMAVAAAVQSGLADAAVGLASAAAALGLGFVPLAREDYDLVLRADFAASDMGRALVATVRGEAFRAAVARLAGYDASRSGEERTLRSRGPRGDAPS